MTEYSTILPPAGLHIRQYSLRGLTEEEVLSSLLPIPILINLTIDDTGYS